MLEKTLESPLDCKEIQPVHPKGDQSWVFSGRTDAEAEIPILWPPDAKSCLIGKDPDAGKDWGQRVGHDWATEVNRWLTLGKSTSNNWEVIYRKFREVPEKPATFSLDSCGSYKHGFIFSNFTELCPYDLSIFLLYVILQKNFIKNVQSSTLQCKAPAPQLESSPHSLQREKAHVLQWRPSTAKNK